MTPNYFEPVASAVSADSLAAQVQLFLFRVPPEDAAIEQLGGVLDPTEAARAAEFRHRQSRSNFIAARAGLRWLAASVMGIPAQSLKFGATKTGKPFLMTNRNPPVDFNLSHSGEHCLIALTMGAPVGVDIQEWHRQVDWRGIAERFFTADERKWIDETEEADRRRRFYECWTLKEAFMKASGAGLAGGLETHSVRSACEDSVHPRLREIADEKDEWFLRKVPLELESYSAAVCWGRSGPSSFRLFRL